MEWVNSKPLVWALMEGELVILQVLCTHTSRTCSRAPPRASSPNATADKQQASSSLLTPSDLTLSCSHHQGQLYCAAQARHMTTLLSGVLQQVNRKANSPTHDLGASSYRPQRARGSGHPSLTRATSQKTKGGTSSLECYSCQGVRPTLLNVADKEGGANSAQCSDINMASDDSPDQRYLHGLR